MARRDRALTVSLTVLAVAGGFATAVPAALAQEGPQSVVEAAAPPVSGQVYEPAFFARFAPQTALDMVRQIPGFTLVQPDDDKRGFGDGGVNALVNGKRLTGKSGGAVDQISRITPDAVLRIEVVDGASLSIPGLSGQVVNIITKPKGMSGTWTWNPQFRGDQKPGLLTGNASVSGESGEFAWTLGAEVQQNRGSAEGWVFVTDADGDITEIREEFIKGGATRPSLNGQLTWSRPAGDVLNLNLTAITANRVDRIISARGGVTDPTVLREIDSGEDAWRVEGSADYEFSLGPGRAKLIGFYNTRHGEEGVRILDDILASPNDPGFGYDEVADNGEGILRSEYTLPSVAGGDWVASLEGAFNFLEVDAIESELVGGVYVDQADTALLTRVEEKRAELSLTHSRSLMKGLDLQANIGGEYSELSVEADGFSGSDAKADDFIRPKGFAQLAWAASPDMDVNLRIAREVGQLNFFDFIASTDLDNNEQDSGNAELVPSQSWLAQVEINKRFGAYGALKTRIYGELIEDIVDGVPIPIRDGTGAITGYGESPGNIDEAERYGVELNGTLNLDPFGIKGAKFDLEVGANESRVNDPLTGQARRISEEGIFNYEIEFRHDIAGTPWAYGLEYNDWTQERYFGLSQFVHPYQSAGMGVAFLEHKDIFGMKGAIVFINLLNNHENLRRTYYDVDVPNGVRTLTREENRNWSLTQRFVQLELSGKF